MKLQASDYDNYQDWYTDYARYKNNELLTNRIVIKFDRLDELFATDKAFNKRIEGLWQLERQQEPGIVWKILNGVKKFFK